MLIILGLLAFSLGYIIFEIYDKKQLLKTPEEIFGIINTSLLLFLVVGLSLITFLGAVLIFYSISTELGGMDVYFKTPILVRNTIVNYQLDPLTPPPVLFKIGNYLINTGFAGTIFGGALFASHKKERLFGLLILIAFIFASLSTVGRYTLFNAIFFFFFSYIYTVFFTNEKVQKKRLTELAVYSVLLILALSMFTLYMMEVRTTIAGENAIKEYALKTTYMYVTGGVSALDNFLDHDFIYTYGQSSFRSIFKWLSRLSLWPETDLKSVHEPFVSITPVIKINTYTFIKSFFEDFGIFGVLILSLLFGISCKISNFLCLRKFSFLRMFIAITLIFTAFMSFYSFYFHSITTIIYRLLIVIIINYVFYNKLYLINSKTTLHVKEAFK